MPAETTPALPALPPPVLRQPAQIEGRPPWEQDLDALPQSQDGAGFPTRGTTGPMYIWNPITNSGPFPAVSDD